MKIRVETSKRTYEIDGTEQVAWLPGEELHSIEVVQEEDR